MDQVATVLDNLEGKNYCRRDLPQLDEGQAIKALLVDASREPCYLDQKEPYCVAVFHVPTGLDILGQGVILYSLCFDCLADITSKSKVEEKLSQYLRTQNAIDADMMSGFRKHINKVRGYAS